MRGLLLSLGAAALLVGGVAVAATAGPDECSEALAELTEQRGRQSGTRAAYAISVRNGYASNVERLGPKMIAGEAETSRLLRAMYEACDSEDA